MSEMTKSEAPRPPVVRGGYDHDRVKRLFQTRQLSEEEREKFLALKAAFEGLCYRVLNLTPSTPHQTIAINKLIEAKDAACLGFITALPEKPRVGTPEQIATTPDYYCPICGAHEVWVGKTRDCCGATWVYCPNGEPYLEGVNSKSEFEAACEKHGALNKEFKLLQIGACLQLNQEPRDD